MSKDNYLSLYFDNLARTASLIEGLMDTIDEGEPGDQILESFEKMRLEIKSSVDERAATLRSLDQCELAIAGRKDDLTIKLKQIKNLKAKLKKKTLDSIAEFKNQPFRGDYCQLQANKTRGRVDIAIHTSKVSLSNVIEPDTYGTTDIPSSCLSKVTYYYVKKDELYRELSKGLEIEDAKLVENRTLKIKDL
jgi:hypothetical protein